MSEICKDCFDKQYTLNKRETVIMSDDVDLCEHCGEWKQVVVRIKVAINWLWRIKNN